MWPTTPLALLVSRKYGSQELIQICMFIGILVNLTSFGNGSGGGNQLNVNLDLGRTPGLWMMSEAINSGALLRPKKVEWDWQNLGAVKESLTGFWHLFEWVPFRRLSYENSTSTTYR